MLDLRFVSLIIGLFAAGYFGVHWVTLGMPIPFVTQQRIVPLQPDPRLESWESRTRRHIAEDREREWRDSQTAQGDGDPERTRLREEVIAAATAFTMSPCNTAFKQRYIAAAAATSSSPSNGMAFPNAVPYLFDQRAARRAAASLAALTSSAQSQSDR